MPNIIEEFLSASEKVRDLDSQGHSLWSEPMLTQYKERNSFGIDPQARIHRIFQREYLEADIASGMLTLPSASAAFWKDPLENPLANVSGIDAVAGGRIDYGAVVRSYHALCWTRRSRPRAVDWDSFSHGQAVTRISTTAKKLLDRTMSLADQSYMHRVWLVDVDYVRQDRIRGMQNPQEVLDRLESTGASLVLSAATVNAKYIDEDEVRLLYDAHLQPLPADAAFDASSGVVRIPFDWDGFVEDREDGP